MIKFWWLNQFLRLRRSNSPRSLQISTSTKDYLEIIIAKSVCSTDGEQIIVEKLNVQQIRPMEVRLWLNNLLVSISYMNSET